MKLLETKDVEECIDGLVIKELLFDAPVDETFIRGLEKLGTLEYFPHFPKPFFRVRKPGAFSIKGVQGNRTVRVFYVNYSVEAEYLIHRTVNQVFK
ncbi:MAG: hypothetical protein HY788_00545 [Deltaproteobacteria bacterium]|nr:hypothetical protein [Deltaproteobacteria bacterium]